MISFGYILIGLACRLIMKSAGIDYDSWEFYGIIACLVAAVILPHFQL